MSDADKIVVGAEEWCAFPSLSIPAVKARVDSGARSSAIHAENIQPFKREGKLWVRFEVLPLTGSRGVSVRCEAPVCDRRVVKSSSGSSEQRYLVSVPVQLGDRQWEIELSLTNRDSMGYRMLLGREAMLGRMVVDPSVQCLHGDLDRDALGALYRAPARPRGGLRIGLLASNPELYSNRRLIEAGESRGHEMLFLDIKQCYMKLDASQPEIHYRGGQILNHLDAVVPRIRPSLTFYGCALVRQYESLGVFPLNASAAITQSRDKLFALQMLLQNGIEIPITGFAHSPTDTRDLIEMVGGAPLIVKLLEGAQGRGVVLAETRKAAESVINAFKSLNANLLVQEFIKEAGGRDLRCFVIDNKVVAAIERTAAPGEFRANIHQGGTASLVRITPAERRLATRSAKAFGLRVAGVDIIRSERGPLLLEVNSSPGLEGVETATGKDIAGAMIAAIERKLHWRPAGRMATTDGVSK